MMIKEMDLRDYKGDAIRMEEPVEEVTLFGQATVLVHLSDVWAFNETLEEGEFIYDRKMYSSGWQYLESNMGIES